MQELDDITLLRQYTEQNSEEAFAALVSRHVNKVYSVALRHTRNPHQAEEITHAVFVILAKKSGQLGKKVVLSGWLYETSRLTAVTFIRSEIRRARREQQAHMQNLLNEADTDVWPKIAPLLDAAMAGLSETDRHAIVLRFFDGKNMKEVGTALGASEDAAKMRVNRAVEKLQRFFLKRGIASTTAILTAAISANSVQAAPVTLAKTVTAVAIATGATASASTLTFIKGALNIMAWTNAKTAIVSAVVVGMAALSVVQHQAQVKLREQNETLQQQQAPLAEQIRQLQKQFADATNRAGNLLAENTQLKSNSNHNELLKLRGQVAVASRVAADATAKMESLGTNSGTSLMDAERNETRAHLNTFFKLANLSPDKADQYVNLEVEIQQRQDARMKALLAGTLSVADAVRQRDQDNQQQQDQRRELLGPDGMDTLQSIADGMRNNVAKGLTDTIQANMGDNPLTPEQSDRLQSAIKAEVAANTMDDTDLFRPVDEWTQMVTDKEQQVLQAASGFLTPSQLGTLQSLEGENLKLLLQKRELRLKALGINP